MRKPIAMVAVATLISGVLVAVASPASASPVKSDRADGIRRQLAAGVQVAPKKGTALAAAKGAGNPVNPYTSLVRDPAAIDYSAWAATAKQKSAERLAQRNKLNAAKAAVTPPPPLLHDEQEPPGLFGANDSHATAELVTGFGTGKNKNNRARILGQFSPEAIFVSSIGAFAEDDGSIPLAGDPGITAFRSGARLSAQIGDGPHGSAGTGNGDFDFQKITAVAGQQITIDTDTPVGPLDTVVAIYDAAGTILAANDDSGGTFDSFLQFQVPVTGTYYALMSAFGIGTVFPDDPFDSGSGFGTGSEGPYDVTITVATPDRDFYAMDLAGGDVVGAFVTGAGGALIVRDPAGDVVMGSDQDASSLYAPNSPLPAGGNATLSTVAPRAGRYSIEVLGSTGTYDITLEAYRPGTEGQKSGTVQTLFLDFNGARVNTAIWGGPGVRDLSPLSGFLGRWGLSAAQESALITQIVQSVKENIVQDLQARGENPRFALKVLNSRDNADPFGQPNVHRIIVGGSIAQSGIDTIGIAQFIDPGNYGNEDSALVLLDVLSDPSGAASLNTYITPASDKIKFLGRAIGNVISHEAGHLYGNFHTDTFNTVPNLMDSGGNFPGLFGVGPDNIGGTADDVDYDFGEDTLSPAEGFIGTEDTLNTSAWGLSKGNKK